MILACNPGHAFKSLHVWYTCFYYMSCNWTCFYILNLYACFIIGVCQIILYVFSGTIPVLPYYTIASNKCGFSKVIHGCCFIFFILLCLLYLLAYNCPFALVQMCGGWILQFQQAPWPSCMWRWGWSCRMFWHENEIFSG